MTDINQSVHATHYEQLSKRVEHIGERIAAGAALRDLERRLPHEELAELAASGLLAATVPRQFGGGGLGVAQLVTLIVQVAKADPNVAQAMQPHFCGVEKLRLYGNARQQEKYLRAIADGVLITNASAERGTGVVGEIRTALVRTTHGWQLDGLKHYATGSLFASYLYVLANDAQGRALAFVPVERVGVSINDDWNGMGQRTTASGSVQLDSVQLSEDEVVLLPEWKSRRTYEGALAQVLHAAIDTGIALAALEDAVAYGRERARPVPEAKVQRASDDPYVQQAVGEMAVLAHGAEALLERAAKRLELVVTKFWGEGVQERELGAVSIAVAEAKVAANDASLKVSEMLYRVGGAAATVRPLNLDRHWRNARTHTTHDPVVYKSKLIGAYLLNDQLPPISTKV